MNLKNIYIRKEDGDNIGFKSIILFILSISLFMICCSNENLIQNEKKLKPVKYIKVVKTFDKTNRIFSGIAKADKESRLSFRVSGVIDLVMVKVGDLVYKGQIIAQLDPTDYRIKVNATKASLSKVLAQKRNAVSNYERIRDLYKNLNVSRNELDIARSLSEASIAAVQSIKNKLKLSERQLKYTRMIAPSTCHIADVMVEENESVVSGQPVVSINYGSRITVEFRVSETLISQIKKNSTVKVIFDAVVGKIFNATITEIGISSAGIETTFAVIAKLNHIDKRIMPGMAAEVTCFFEKDNADGKFIVPSFAVGKDVKGTFVFVVLPLEKESGRIQRRSIVLGEFTPKGFEIIEGVSSGDLVVIAGINKIEDKDIVLLNRGALN
jgi:RND family efflux transporter MFP subunit